MSAGQRTPRSTKKPAPSPEIDHSSSSPENSEALDYVNLSDRTITSQVPHLTSSSQVLAAQRTYGNRVVQRILAAQTKTASPAKAASKTSLRTDAALKGVVQLFRDEDVEKRAHKIWQDKGSPENQNEEDKKKDYLEAKRQLSIEDRSHGVWQEKGSPENQGEEDKKKDYSVAELQIDTLNALNSAADAAVITKALTDLKAKTNFSWKALHFTFRETKKESKTLIRDNAGATTAYFGLCKDVAEKAEALYFIGGLAAWKRTTMTAQAITHNEQREALVRLGVFEKGAVDHKAGPEVDALIAKHLKNFVQNNLETRGKITGRIAVLGPEDWDVIGKEDYGAQWVTKKNTLNAFVDRSSDPPRVFVNQDRGNAGTAIHEACHMWGHSTRPINAVSHDLNEGVTEYFARKVCNALTPVIPRTVYGNQFKVANKLVALIGEDKVSEAFFDGTVASMSIAFNTIKGPNKWDDFIDAIEDGDFDQAVVLATP